MKLNVEYVAVLERWKTFSAATPFSAFRFPVLFEAKKKRGLIIFIRRIDGIIEVHSFRSGWMKVESEEDITLKLREEEFQFFFLGG